MTPVLSRTQQCTAPTNNLYKLHLYKHEPSALAVFVCVCASNIFSTAMQTAGERVLHQERGGFYTRQEINEESFTDLENREY